MTDSDAPKSDSRVLGPNAHHSPHPRRGRRASGTTSRPCPPHTLRLAALDRAIDLAATSGSGWSDEVVVGTAELFLRYLEDGLGTPDGEWEDTDG